VSHSTLLDNLTSAELRLKCSVTLQIGILKTNKNITEPRDLSAGYEYVGDIANPLEADVTAVLGEQASAARWRVERQMIRVINQGRRTVLLGYLAAKRRLSGALAAKSGYAAPA
jgi:hypothetical protein